MKQNASVYYATGDVESLFKELRNKGFGVPHCWEETINESIITRKISPNLETMSSRIEKDGTIIDSVITGDVIIEKKSRKQKIVEFKLEVYLNQLRGEELFEFANGYTPKAS